MAGFGLADRPRGRGRPLFADPKRHKTRQFENSYLRVTWRQGEIRRHMHSISQKESTLKIEFQYLEKRQWRRRPEIADFCPLSWTNLS